MPDNKDLGTEGGDDLPGRLLSFEVEERLRAIFAIVKTQTGQDLSLYKESTVLRRIERRMGANNVGDLAGYIDLLGKSRQEVQDLCRDILIGVTSFFRDPEAFGVLAREVLPQLFAGRDPDDPIRIWHAGCATGEEAYSTAIMARAFLAEKNLSNRVQIFATDLDEGAIVQARSGFFSADIVAAFGEGIVALDGSIDRAQLGRLVFGNTARLAQLSAIVWPLTRRLVEQLGDRRDQSRWLTTMAVQRWAEGRWPDALLMLARAAETHRRLGDAASAAESDYNRAEGLERQGGVC